MKLYQILAAAALVAAFASSVSCKSGADKPAADAGAVAVDDSTDRILPAAEVEESPLFQGKEPKAFAEWVGKKISFPKEAADSMHRGVVVVGFVIDKSGRVVDVKVEKSVSYLLDSIAAATVKESPIWTPGKVNGEPVQVSYRLPVNFSFK